MEKMYQIMAQKSGCSARRLLLIHGHCEEYAILYFNDWAYNWIWRETTPESDEVFNELVGSNFSLKQFYYDSMRYWVEEVEVDNESKP